MQSRWQTWVDLITPQPGSSVTTAGITGSPCWRACQMKDAAWCRSSSGPLPSLFSCPKQSHTQRRPLETPAPVFDWSLIESAMATGGNILQPFVGGGFKQLELGGVSVVLLVIFVVALFIHPWFLFMCRRALTQSKEERWQRTAPVGGDLLASVNPGWFSVEECRSWRLGKDELFILFDRMPPFGIKLVPLQQFIWLKSITWLDSRCTRTALCELEHRPT